MCPGTVAAWLHQRSSFDPYVELYEYIGLALESIYFSPACPAHTSISMIRATAELLARCPEELILGALMKVQKTLSIWLSDRDFYLAGADNSELLKEVGLPLSRTRIF